MCKYYKGSMKQKKKMSVKLRRIRQNGKILLEIKPNAY